MSQRATRLRLLPAAIAVLALMLGLKVLDVASVFGIGAARAEEKPAEVPASVTETPAHTDEEAPAVVETPDAPNAGPTASESDVLESLAQRREQLDARERELDMREKVVGAAEKRVEERIAELKKIEAHVEEMFGQRDEAEQQQITALIKTYEAMKPAAAAQIFNTLNRTVLLQVVTGMKPAKVAPILAAMQPEAAQELTVALAERLNIPAAPEAEEAPAEAPAETAPETTPEAAAQPAPEAAPGG